MMERGGGHGRRRVDVVNGRRRVKQSRGGRGMQRERRGMQRERRGRRRRRKRDNDVMFDRSFPHVTIQTSYTISQF